MIYHKRIITDNLNDYLRQIYKSGCRILEICEPVTNCFDVFIFDFDDRKEMDYETKSNDAEEKG